MLRTVRQETLIWVGTAGVVATLLVHLSPVLELADWCRPYVDGWSRLLHGFWGSLGTLLVGPVPQAICIALTTLFFVLVIAIGGRLAAGWRGLESQLRIEVTPGWHGHRSQDEAPHTPPSVDRDRHTSAINAATDLDAGKLVARATRYNQSFSGSLFGGHIYHVFYILLGFSIYRNLSGAAQTGDWASYAIGYSALLMIVALLAAWLIYPPWRLNARLRWVIVILACVIGGNYASLYAWPELTEYFATAAT